MVLEAVARKVVPKITVKNQGNLEVTFWFEDEYRQVIEKIKQIHYELPNAKMQGFLNQIGEGGVLCG